MNADSTQTVAADSGPAGGFGPTKPNNPIKGNKVPRPRSRESVRWRLNRFSALISLIGVTGLLIFMYPPTAAWWSQYHESKAVKNYTQEVQQDPPPGNAVQIENARQYNSLLSAGNIVVGADSNKPTFLGEAVDDSGYWDLLHLNSNVMARLKIPAIALDLPIYHGTSDAVLEKGVGHLQGTSLPVGGQDTHSVLTAHTGLAKATLFDNLEKLDVGDTFTIEVIDQVLTYKVTETRTILPSETESLIVRRGEDLVTLVTCTPLGLNTHRYLVTGERITPTPLKDLESAQRVPEVPYFPWWAVIIPAGFALAGIYVWRSGYSSKP